MAGKGYRFGVKNKNRKEMLLEPSSALVRYTAGRAKIKYYEVVGLVESLIQYCHRDSLDGFVDKFPFDAMLGIMGFEGDWGTVLKMFIEWDFLEYRDGRLVIKDFQKTAFRPKRASDPRTRLSNTMRFNVLTRDNFTCQYCGAKAPDVRLNVDHKIPCVKGGLNVGSNLITSCEFCNNGKSDKCLAPAS